MLSSRQGPKGVSRTRVLSLYRILLVRTEVGIQPLAQPCVQPEVDIAGDIYRVTSLLKDFQECIHDADRPAKGAAGHGDIKTDCILAVDERISGTATCK